MQRGENFRCNVVGLFLGGMITNGMLGGVGKWGGDFGRGLRVSLRCWWRSDKVGVVIYHQGAHFPIATYDGLMF